jgi:hypothetical protein
MKTRTKKLLGYTIVGGCVPAVAGLIGCMATRAAHAADVTMPTKYLGQWCLANGGINDQFEYRRPTNSADFKTCSSMIVRVNGFFGSAAGDCKLVDIFPHVRVKGYNAIFNCNHDAYAHDGRSPELRSVWFGNYGPNTLTFEPNATAADEIKIDRALAKRNK